MGVHASCEGGVKLNGVGRSNLPIYVNKDWVSSRYSPRVRNVIRYSKQTITREKHKNNLGGRAEVDAGLEWTQHAYTGHDRRVHSSGQ